MNKYKSVKVFGRTYNNIEDIQQYLIRSRGIHISKSTILNFIVEKYKANLQKISID